MTIKEKIAFLEALDEIIAECERHAEWYEPNDNGEYCDIFTENRHKAYQKSQNPCKTLPNRGIIPLFQS